MKINIDKMDNISALLSVMPSEYYTRALNDAVQIILNSTKQRYMKEETPEGEKWPDNAEWYKEMKGGAATLTGPLSKKIKSGPYAKRYEFSETNKKKMKNSLIHNIDGISKTAIIYYDSESEERAALHQFGGESKLVLASTTGGKDLELLIDVPERPHLGVSKEDADKIEEVFGGMLESRLA